MAKLDAELTKHGKAHEFYVYKDTGHSLWTRIIRKDMSQNPIACRGTRHGVFEETFGWREKTD